MVVAFPIFFSDIIIVIYLIRYMMKNKIDGYANFIHRKCSSSQAI